MRRLLRRPTARRQGRQRLDAFLPVVLGIPGEDRLAQSVQRLLFALSERGEVRPSACSHACAPYVGAFVRRSGGGALPGGQTGGVVLGQFRGGGAVFVPEGSECRGQDVAAAADRIRDVPSRTPWPSPASTSPPRRPAGRDPATARAGRGDGTAGWSAFAPGPTTPGAPAGRPVADGVTGVRHRRSYAGVRRPSRRALRGRASGLRSPSGARRPGLRQERRRAR